MNRLLVLIIILILMMTFFLAPSDELTRVRTGLRDTIFSLLPAGCYLPVQGIKCHNVKIAESGIEVSVKNNVLKWIERDRDFGSFVMHVDSCPYSVAAQQGLLYREEEKFVFRNCSVGDVGSNFRTKVKAEYVEGPVEYGVGREREGWIFGEVTY